MGGIPGTKKSVWLKGDTAGELIGSLPPVIAAVVTVIGLAVDSRRPPWIAWLASAGMVWLVVASVHRVYRARTKDRERAETNSPRDLTGCVYVLYGLLCDRCEIKDEEGYKLRITVHRVVPPSGSAHPTELEQVIPYVGGRGGDAGRRFSIKSGMIGLAARHHSPYSMSWDGTNPKAFIQQLVGDYNYTREEAESLVKDRRSWLAVPISGRHARDTIGVLFMDSCEPELITDDVKKLVLQATVGVAGYIRERYGLNP